MKAVILQNWRPDSSNYNFQNLLNAWEGISDIPEITGYRVEIVIGFFITEENFNEELFIRHPNIRYLATLSHGYAEMDKALTQKYGVTVTNTIYGAEAIAEFTLGLLFDICKNVQTNSDIVKSTDWTDPQPGSWFIPATRQLEISGKTIGIIGLGNIGFQLARKSDALGMHVLGYSRTYKEGLAYQFIDQVSLEQLLEESDIISINTPLTSETYHLIDRAAIDQMKHGVILLNTARGEIIDELALTEALKSGKIYAAGLDVLSEEPPPKISNCSSWIMSESRSISHGVRRKQTCGPSKSPWIIWSITFRINLRV
ncbi:2-hydroxyacid dehydrogenase [Trichococcus shcherbakoviae]|uniref:D-isomer specific 2-hydroxyacid dehydrogenase NAD-binding domain-containing protein n=1 Tax=Trichococcus shcherbakoviae subsp. psychrophilus TaxID=2585775 RepID=A0A5C5EC26_9LACT|nr:NAD(P)-dependent oxidoreductase [Trichococcus shcherbakoviae]TNV70370.1 hypothetical protein FHK04_03875 [Trichococcus shcherbakoviae subsp. psychrophilus]